MTTVQEPQEIELQLGPDDESPQNGREEELETPSLRPVDDHGGPTSSYRGEIGDIGQIVMMFENLVSGRGVSHGMEIDASESILAPDEPDGSDNGSIDAAASPESSGRPHTRDDR